MHGPPVRYGAEVAVSAAERRAALAELRAHARRGRLDPSEVEDRCERVLAARVRAEVAAVLADLPTPSGRPRRHPMPRWVSWHRLRTRR